MVLYARRWCRRLRLTGSEAMMTDAELIQESLYSIPLFKKKLAKFGAHRAALLESIQRFRQRDPGNKRSNVGGWHSSDIRHLKDDPPFGWLFQQLIAASVECIGRVRPRAQSGDVFMDSAWIVINRAGEWNKPHTHMPSQWSGVFYCQVDESIDDRDEGHLLFIDPIPLGPHYRNPVNAFVRPENGLMVLFPSYLTHMVEPHRRDLERIVISFNLRLLSHSDSGS
jgi:uncharacterized protein (TIGR02466 family)